MQDIVRTRQGSVLTAQNKVQKLAMSMMALALLLTMLLAAGQSVASPLVSSFDDVEQQLSQRNFNHKVAAINWLVSHADSSSEQTKALLNALLAGQVFYHKKQRQLFLITDYAVGQKALRITHVSQHRPHVLLIGNKRDYKKVALNNKLRSRIRLGMAQLDLNASDSELRKQAIISLMDNIDNDIQTALAARFLIEAEVENKQLLTTALAIASLLQFDNRDDAANATLHSEQLAAITVLSHSLEPAAFVALTAVVNRADNAEVVAAAKHALANYQQSQQIYSTIETLYFGLSLGSVLALAGIGLAITFGVMGVINMAHGELIMLGAYTSYVMQLLLPNDIGLALLLSIPAAFVVSGLVGIAIERGVIRFLYGRPLETLLATFGISLILQQAVRSIFSPLNRSVQTPEWMTGMLEFNPMLALTYNRLYIIIFCLLVFITLIYVVNKTPLGLQVRAVSQNRAMARAMGVRSEWVDAMTFGLGAGVAGIAGVALSQLTNVGPNMGQSYIIDSFMVVVFGGVGNLWGTLVAGLSLGIFNKLLEPWAGAVLAKILVLIFIILFIQKRPRGLFPQRGRTAED